MFEYITTQEAAGKWEITVRRVQVLCTQGRVPGAIRHGWSWAIPVDAAKPEDARINKKSEGTVKRKKKK